MTRLQHAPTGQISRRITVPTQSYERSERGQVLVIVAMSIIVLIALVGLVIDGGLAWGHQRNTQNVADATAKAGAAVLAERGISSRSLGPALPASALAAAVRRIAPAVVVLWSQLPPTANADVVASLPTTRPRFRTFVAGPGWAKVALPPGVVLLPSLAHAEDQIGTLLR